MNPNSPKSYHEITHERLKNMSRSLSPKINKDHSIHSTNTSEFTVHPGPSLLHSPLGQSNVSTDHYIKPVYPNYVTEYEDAYKWPSTGNDINSIIDQQISTSDLPTSKQSFKITNPLVNKTIRNVNEPISLNDILNVTDIDIESNPWITMEKSVHGLLLTGHEKTLSSGILDKVKNHQLDEGMEYAYQHLLTRLSVNLSSLQLSSKELEEEKQVRDIINIFVKSVRKVKNF